MGEGGKVTKVKAINQFCHKLPDIDYSHYNNSIHYISGSQPVGGGGGRGHSPAGVRVGYRMGGKKT